MYAQMQANKERLRKDARCFNERIMPADLELAIDTARTIQHYTPRATPRLNEE